MIDEAGNTFISEDLDVTRNLFAEGMTSDQYQEQQDAALANAMEIKQTRENNLRNLFGETSQ